MVEVIGIATIKWSNVSDIKVLHIIGFFEKEPNLKKIVFLSAIT